MKQATVQVMKLDPMWKQTQNNKWHCCNVQVSQLKTGNLGTFRILLKHHFTEARDVEQSNVVFLMLTLKSRVSAAKLYVRGFCPGNLTKLFWLVHKTWGPHRNLGLLSKHVLEDVHCVPDGQGYSLLLLNFLSSSSDVTIKHLLKSGLQLKLYTEVCIYYCKSRLKGMVIARKKLGPIRGSGISNICIYHGISCQNNLARSVPFQRFLLGAHNPCWLCNLQWPTTPSMLILCLMRHLGISHWCIKARNVRWLAVTWDDSTSWWKLLK